MSKNIFSDKVDYVNRFLTNQSRYLQFPSCVYQDAKLHASERDHIVVISEMKMPKGQKEDKLDMKYSYCESFLTPENTNELLREQIEAAEREVKERDIKGSSGMVGRDEKWAKWRLAGEIEPFGDFLSL